MLSFFKKHNTKILLFLILLLASFFRFYDISNTPFGIYPDEALNANNAIEVMQSGDYKIFYPENYGREGLFINLIALSFSIFGIGILQLKAVGALIGVITVFSVYFLTKELLKKTLYSHHGKYIALFSAFFIATSFWHINFSRIAFRGILIPLFLTLGILSLVYALRNKSWKISALSGAIFGIGIYTYSAFLASSLIVLFLFLSYGVGMIKKVNTFSKKEYVSNISAFFIAFAITSSLLLVTFSNGILNTTERISSISILNSENPLKELAKNTYLTLGQFNVSGDCNPRHNYDCQPQLFWLVGIFFIIGIFISFKNIKKIPFALLLVWFFSMLLPSILSSEGIPHSLRSIGSLVPVYIFSGIGAFYLLLFSKEKLDKYSKKEKFVKYKNQISRIEKELSTLLFIVLIFLSYGQFDKYFNNFANSSQTESGFNRELRDIASTLNKAPDKTKKYIIVNTNGVWIDSLPIQAQSVIFLTPNVKNISYLREDSLSTMTIEAQTIIIPLKQEVEIFKKIQKEFPGGKILLDGRTIIYELLKK